MRVEHVPVEWVHRVWGAVEQFLGPAIEHSKGEYTLDLVKAYVAEGRWALLVASEDSTIHGAATIDFFNRANDRVAFVTTIGGKLISNDENFKQLKDFVISRGATAMEGAVRDSVARMLKRYGFEEKYSIIEVKL